MSTKRLSRRQFLKVSSLAAGAALLAACQPATPPPTEEPAAPQEPQAPAEEPTPEPQSEAPDAGLQGEISYFTYDLGPANKSREDAVAAFGAANPGAKVNLTVLPYGELFEKISAMMASGQPPDVMYGDYSLLRNVLDDQMLDLTEMFKADNTLTKPELFTMPMDDDMQAKYGSGKIVALIMGTWTPILYYNIDLFDKAGVTYPTEDWTWEDLRIAAKKLTNPADQQFGFQQGTVFDNVGWMWWNHKPQDFWATPQIFPEKTIFKEGPGEAVFNIWYQLGYEDKSMITREEQNTYQVYGGAFGAGKAAMYNGGDWDAGWGFRDLEFKWGMTLTPKVLKDYRPSLNCMVATNLIAAATKNADLSWAFARFISASAEGQTIIGQGAYETPVLKEVAHSDAVLKPEWAAPGYEYRVKAAELPPPMYTPYQLSLNLWEYPSKYIDPTYDQVSKGEITPKDAVEYLDQEGVPYFQKLRQDMNA
jgi:multiple sugar transport system substrate-binding protein